MRINQIIIKESDVGTSTAGSMATVAKPLGETQKRNTTVRGLEPADKVIKGTAKKKGPYANSLSEGKKVDEAKIDEEDSLLKPGIGRKLKPGFHKIDPDKAEHEGQTLKNSLHTIIRVATELDKQLSTKDNFPEWVSEKIGATKGMMVAVAEYLESAKEMQHDPDAVDECGGVIAGGLQYENVEGDQEESEKNLRYSRSRSPAADAIRKKLNPNQKDEKQVNEKAVSKAQQRFMGMAHAMQKGEKIPGASKELKAAAKGMTKKATHDYAATKQKGLPEKVKK